MRARNIKPAFFKNDILAECSPMARLLYIGLWCIADREGRLELRPKRIRAEIFPYENCKIESLLEELRKSGFIIAYKFDDNLYLEIPTFIQHQNCHIKEAASTIPAPCEHESCTILAQPLTESLLLNTESPLPQSGAKTTRLSGDVSRRFDLFWKAYPKKKSKGDAEKAFRAINPNEQLLETMISTIEQAKTSEQWTKDEGQYIPYPATWLRAKGWEDENSKINDERWANL
jgi:hypothetical protein